MIENNIFSIFALVGIGLIFYILFPSILKNRSASSLDKGDLNTKLLNEYSISARQLDYLQVVLNMENLDTTYLKKNIINLVKSNEVLMEELYQLHLKKYDLLHFEKEEQKQIQRFDKILEKHIVELASKKISYGKAQHEEWIAFCFDFVKKNWLALLVKEGQPNLIVFSNYAGGLIESIDGHINSFLGYDSHYYFTENYPFDVFEQINKIIIVHLEELKSNRRKMIISKQYKSKDTKKWERHRAMFYKNKCLDSVLFYSLDANEKVNISDCVVDALIDIIDKNHISGEFKETNPTPPSLSCETEEATLSNKHEIQRASKDTSKIISQIMAEIAENGALIIDKPWIDLILSGKKKWEMRATRFKKIGYIGLIEKGTKTVVGVAKIVGYSGPLNSDELKQSFEYHQVTPDLYLKESYKWRVAMKLDNITSLPHPVSYDHKSGVVIWVKLSEQINVLQGLERELK